MLSWGGRRYPQTITDGDAEFRNRVPMTCAAHEYSSENTLVYSIFRIHTYLHTYIRGYMQILVHLHKLEKYTQDSHIFVVVFIHSYACIRK